MLVRYFCSILLLPLLISSDCNLRNDHDNDEEADFCEITTSSPITNINCFDHFVYINGFCYGKIDYINIHNYDVAEDVCSRLDGHLASIHSENELHLIINNFVTSREDEIWIGLRCKNGGLSCYWEDRSTVDYLPSHGIRNCGTIRAGSMFTDDCPNKHFWICKRMPYKVEINADETTDFATNPSPNIVTLLNAPACIDHYIYYEPTGFCYGIIDYINYHDFAVAEDWCVHLDGHLASIHSQHEQDFLINYVKAVGHPLYIGLHDIGGGVYKWTDGSPTDFMPAHFDHQCGVLSERGMYFDHCEITHFWICKKNPIV